MSPRVCYCVSYILFLEGGFKHYPKSGSEMIGTHLCVWECLMGTCSKTWQAVWEDDIPFLGGGFKHFWNFHPELWGRFPIWRAYFSDGLVQPPTSFLRIVNTAGCEPSAQATRIPFRRPQRCGWKSLLGQILRRKSTAWFWKLYV